MAWVGATGLPMQQGDKPAMGAGCMKRSRPGAVRQTGSLAVAKCQLAELKCRTWCSAAKCRRSETSRGILVHVPPLFSFFLLFNMRQQQLDGATPRPSFFFWDPKVKRGLKTGNNN